MVSVSTHPPIVLKQMHWDMWLYGCYSAMKAGRALISQITVRIKEPKQAKHCGTCPVDLEAERPLKAEQLKTMTEATPQGCLKAYTQNMVVEK